MKKLIRTTELFCEISASKERLFSQAVLAIFPDGAYLKEYLKECAKRFFGAEEGTREAELIDREIYSDFKLFPSDKKYTVDMCSEILEECTLLPVESERKLLTLSDFQTASAAVQNKLLKVLEEPPPGVCFLLGATVESPILPTVLSRVKKIAEQPFSVKEIANALERNYGKGEQNYAAAAACGGRYSTAEGLVLGHGEQFRLAEQFLAELNASACEEAGKSKSPNETIAAMRAILRDVYFVRKGLQKYATGVGKSDLCAKYCAGVALFALSELDRIEADLNFNADFANCLLSLALKIKEETDKWKKLS